MSMKRIQILLLVTAVVALTAACKAPEQAAAPAPPDYRAINGPAFDTYLEIWNTQDFDKLGDVFAENFHRMGPDQNANGPEELKAFMEQTLSAYPDFHIVAGESLYDNDLSFNQWTVTGTATREDGTTVPIEVNGATMLRYVDGKITEEWVYYDTAQITGPVGQSEMPHAK